MIRSRIAALVITLMCTLALTLPLGAMAGAAATASGAVAGAAFSAESAAAGKAIKGRAKPWKGAGVKVGRRVPGWSWIGARRVDKRVVYRADAFKKRNARRYTPPKRMTTYNTTGSTARAAWVVSKYGSVRSSAQGAAVEIALHALLYPKKRSLGSKSTKRRFQAVGGRKGTVAKYARSMVKDSRKFAGPYKLETSTLAVSAGTPATLIARVVSATGYPIAGVPVIFTRPDSTTSTVKTDQAGTARQVVPATPDTWVRATATELPASALSVMKPTAKQKKATRKLRKRASRLVVASPRRYATAADILVKVKAQPSATVVHSPAGALKIGDKFTPVLRTTGGGAGTATVNLYGPFSNQQAADCTPGSSAPIAYQQIVQVAGDGDQPLLPVTLTTAGFYRWNIEIAGTGDREARSVCDPAFQVNRWQPSLTIKQPGEAVLSAFDAFNFEATYAGAYPTDAQKGYRIHVSGPFGSKDAAVCNGPGAVPALGGSFATGNTTNNGASLNTGGWFRVTGSVDANSTNEAAQAACGAPFYVSKHAVRTDYVGQGQHAYNGSLYLDLTVKYLGITAPAGSGATNPMVVGQLHGPFPNAESVDCFSNEYTPSRVSKQVEYSGQNLELTFHIPTPGWYVGSAVIYEGPWYLPSIQCGHIYSTG